MKRIFAFALAVTSMSCVTVLADTCDEPKIGTLRLKVHFREGHTKNEAIQVIGDQSKNSAEVPDQSFQINQNKTIKNFVLVRDRDRNGSLNAKVPIHETTREKVPIQLGDDGFSPRVLLIRKNSILEVKHVGDVRHNANLRFLREPLRSLVVPKRDDQTTLERSTAVPVPISCDVHPHEMAWVLVHDHPFAGISDDEGLIVIRDLPVGEVRFRLWHELLITRVAKPTIHGQPAKTEDGRIVFEIKAGENPEVDLEFTSESFRLP